MAPSGTVALKSFQSFVVSEDLLAKTVEAVKAGEKLARSSGDIQSFEVLYRGFRMNLVIGKLMIIPPSIANSLDNFPVALLYGALVRQFGGEEMAELISQKVGDNEFDEYSKADLASIKDTLFKNEETGRFEALVMFVPAWHNKREYICFKFTKDDVVLADQLRHLVFSCYYNPAVSSAFNALMTDVATDKLDVTDITPKLTAPGLTESPLREFPNLEKVAGNNRKKLFLTPKTADAVTQEQLEPAELNVFDALSQAMNGVKRPQTVSVEQAGKQAGYICPACQNGLCGECKNINPSGNKPCTHGCFANQPSKEADATQQKPDPTKAPMKPHKADDEEKKDQGGGLTSLVQPVVDAVAESPELLAVASEKKACGTVVEGTNVGPGHQLDNAGVPGNEDVGKDGATKPSGIELNEDGTAKSKEVKASIVWDSEVEKEAAKHSLPDGHEWQEDKGAPEGMSVFTCPCGAMFGWDKDGEYEEPGNPDFHKHSLAPNTTAIVAADVQELAPKTPEWQAHLQQCPTCQKEIQGLSQYPPVSSGLCPLGSKLWGKKASKIAGTITLANKTQVMLYKTFLTGQMSDGAWENSGPRDHWRPMNQATVQIGQPGMDFTPVRTYDYLRVMPFIGEEMLYAAKAFQAYPNLDLQKAASAIGYVCQEGPENMTADWQQKYVQEILQATGETDINQVVAKIKGQPYNEADLRKDLREIKAVVNGKYKAQFGGNRIATMKIARDIDVEMTYKGVTFKLTTWQERDRFNIDLTADGNQIFDFWDEDAQGVVEDGWISFRNGANGAIKSAIEYAEHLGLLKDVFNGAITEASMPSSEVYHDASSSRSRQAAIKNEEKLRTAGSDFRRRMLAEEGYNEDAVLGEVLDEIGPAPLIDLPGQNSGTTPEAKVPEIMKSQTPEETKGNAEEPAKAEETALENDATESSPVERTAGKKPIPAKQAGVGVQRYWECLMCGKSLRAGKLFCNRDHREQWEADHQGQDPLQVAEEMGFKESSEMASDDTQLVTQVAAEMFPGFDFADLGTTQQREVINKARQQKRNGKQAEDVSQDLNEAKSELDFTMNDLADHALSFNERLTPEHFARADREDDVPVSKGESVGGEQPTSDLNGPAPEAHDVPSQVDSKTAKGKQALTIGGPAGQGSQMSPAGSPASPGTANDDGGTFGIDLLASLAVSIVSQQKKADETKTCKVCKKRPAQKNDSRCKECMDEQHTQAERATGVQ